jgi:hypothetical protein
MTIMRRPSHQASILLLLFSFIASRSLAAGALTPHDIVLHQLQAETSYNDSSFFQDFPYDSYLDHCDITDLALIEADRTLMEQNGRDGDLFLQKLFARSIARHPVNPTSMIEVKRVFYLADEAAAFHTGDNSHDQIYRAISGRLLNDLSDRVEKAILNRTLVKGNSEAEYVVRVSADHHYYHQFPVSRWDKFCLYVRKGEFQYIAKRIPQELYPYRITLFALFAAFVVALLLIMRLHHRRRLAQTTTTSSPREISTKSILVLLMLSLLCLGNRVVAQVPCSAVLNRLSESPDGVFYNGDMTIRKLYDGTQLIGHMVWFNRASNNIHAKFFADGNVYQRFLAFDRQPNERTLLVSVGGFTEVVQNNLKIPQGLTIDNGSVVNYTMNLNMDGMVIFYPNGGIVVSDIKRDYLTLDNSLKLDIRDPDQRETFIHWAVTNNATVFQTQLLASKRGMLLDPCNARKEYRERRFLAIVKARSNGDVYHVMVNVPQSYYLGDLTNLVYHYLNGFVDVYGLYNMDVGFGDVLFAYDPSGKVLDHPKGTRDLSTATNLIVYYFQH